MSVLAGSVGRVIQRALLDTRLAVRHALTDGAVDVRCAERGPLLVALSGGADSLALAAAVAYESRRLGFVAGAIVVDHGLQLNAAAVADAAAAQARSLGLDPVIVKRVTVGSTGGPEGAAREARYAAFLDVAREVGASAILTAHTRDDQAEQVLLALVRGSGLRSLAGIPISRPLRAERRTAAKGTATETTNLETCDAAGDLPTMILRPFLWPSPEITRAVTVAACAEAGLVPWQDPHNSDHAYTRVRVRERVLPSLRDELGEGVTASLARTADLAREDADALDELTAQFIAAEVRISEGDALASTHCESLPPSDPADSACVGEVQVAVAALAALPVALRNRVIRRIASRWFAAHLSRERTRAIAALISDWRGQGPLQATRLRVRREHGELVFSAGAAADGDAELQTKPRGGDVR